mgnify:CR=1 FL=1
MKKQFRLWLTACGAFFVAGHSVFLSSCNDDLPAGSYYTFTGEMMSDYLKSREDFSLFTRIVERAGQMDFLASRGGRTLLGVWLCFRGGHSGGLLRHTCESLHDRQLDSLYI